MQDFTKKMFAHPPAHFHPGYFWMLNDRIDEDQMLSQLRDMAAHGAKSVCLHPCPPEFRPRIMPTYVDRPYLSKAYFKLIQKLVSECRKLGMSYWLYDEGGFPSGSACGQVLATHPDTFLRQNIVNSDNGPVVLKRVSDPLAGAPYPNLLTPGVTETFIALTHERHRQYVGEEFGQTIRFAFMDEPKAPITGPGQLTWTDDLGDVFHTRKGYAIEPFFADLLSKPCDREPKAVTQARVDFYDVWSQLFVERFLTPIRTWCRQNNILSGGHFGGEDEPGGNADYGYGHILRALRGLDLPGVDAIWRQLFPAQKGGTVYYDEVANKLRTTRGKLSRPFTKYASSVARQAGRPYVLTETFAIYGNGLTPTQMKWVTDQQYLHGATLLVVSNISQSSRDHFMAGGRPHFGDINPLWQYSDLFHHYVARLGYLLSRGQAVHSTALYYDVRSIWAGATHRKKAIALHFAISDHLLKRQCDFDYIDDDTLAAGHVSQGALTVGHMRYDTIVVPATDWMAPAARQTLEKFKASGGRVLSEHQADHVSPMVAITPRHDNIRCTKRAWKGHVLYFLTNEATRTVCVQIAVQERGTPVLCYPMDGKFYAIPFVTSPTGTTIDWRFEPCGSALFLFGAKADATRTVFHPSRRILRLDQGWTLQPLRQHRVGLHDYEIVVPQAKPKPANLGDWRRHLGDYFSGDAIYAINFDNPFCGDALLDLGTVNYACTVKLNGVEIARKCWGPYTINLSGQLRQGENRLEVIVTNTLANAIADPKVLQHWRTNCQPLSAYENKQRTFEKDSLASGLVGPVRIRFGRNVLQTPCPKDT